MSAAAHVRPFSPVAASSRLRSAWCTLNLPHHGRRSRRRHNGHPHSQSAALPRLPRHQYSTQALFTDANNRLAVKDNIAVRGLPTTCDSAILADAQLPIDATIVTQLRGAGLRVVAKAGMDEFAMGSHSTTAAVGEPVRNAPPLSDYSAGGSSGGSAVALVRPDPVADLALGTDTGGSVRIPAAYTATVGFKPSYGMLSRHGVIPYANSLDTVGLMARSVRPVRNALVHQRLYASHDPLDPTSIPQDVRHRCTEQRECYESAVDAEPISLRGLTFGLPLEYNIEELDPRVRQAWSDAAAKLESMGARVVPVTLPSTKMALSAYYVIAPAEAASNLAKYDGIRYGNRSQGEGESGGGGSDSRDGVLYAGTRGDGFGDEVKRRILLGSYTLSSEAIDNYFIQAQRVRRQVRRDFDRVFRLQNPLVDPQPFDLSDMDERVVLDDKLGPPQVDFLLSPTAPAPPPLLADVARQTPLDAYTTDVMTVPASLAGLPAISLPVDLPAAEDGPKQEQEQHPQPDFGGLQLIGQYWDDARLLAVAEAIEGHMSRRVAEEVRLMYGQDSEGRAAAR